MDNLIKSIFKNNTVLINIIEACGIILLGAALFDDLLAGQAGEIILLSAGLYLIILSLPTVTALALLQQDREKLQKLMHAANWCLIILWVIAAVFVLTMKFPKSWIVIGAIFFALPAWINIRALSLVIKGEKNVKQRRRGRRVAR